MPIQFRCTSCGKLLQTGDDTAGQQAQCPACGSVMAIPGAAAAPSGDVAAPPALPPPLAGDAADPAVQAAYLHVWAASRVAAPAIAIIILGILTIVLQVFAVIVNILHVSIAAAFGKNAGMVPLLDGGLAQIPFVAISIVAAIVITIGGMRMRNLENYGLCMTAAILLLIPCCGPCCGILGIPVGIWALATLSDNVVRSAFRS
jgi:phage FluMu protein Com